ncbi:MAG: OmpA family protein [Sphingobium sp.]|mgnify:CR=1 FL=1|jgi:outer membrane protein OmpA-like peptidoglycan-associated protein|nr:OmpA family protein [Sphingobium sp.]MCI1270849.1 OmpA family protein [Sphingobium sp.]MCI1756773.1 OmpA family protein [Sphingobium sp.]MCI2052360.1 OmpA family protein [Sphingobium sp.]
MRKINKAGLGALMLALTTTACVTDPTTGRKTISKAAIGGVGGALGGYLLGDLVGGKRDRTEKILGAGIGAVAGAGIGAYMDAQEKKLRERTAGTGVEVARNGDDLLLRMPSGITFATDSDAVQPQFQPTLNQVASVLAEYPKTYIDIYGHTDSDGSDVYNQGLSERRAGSVQSYLATHGIQSVRMAAKGFGESQPIASNGDPVGKAQNRRVEIKIVPVTQSDVSAS